MKRLFLALWPEYSTRINISAVIDQLQASEFNLYRPSNLHVTLVFLGDVDANTEIDIRRQIEQIKSQPFSLCFDTLSYWYQPSVLCLTSSQRVPGMLSMLVRDLDDIAKSCGLITDARPFTPHITLARKASFKPELAFQAINWTAQDLCLVESVSSKEGVIYQVLASWPLIGRS